MVRQCTRRGWKSSAPRQYFLGVGLQEFSGVSFRTDLGGVSFRTDLGCRGLEFRTQSRCIQADWWVLLRNTRVFQH